MPGPFIMGFKGRVFRGTAGSEATNLLTNVGDITYTIDHAKAPTTIRGDGSAVPIQTESVVEIVLGIEWTMKNSSADTHLEALRVAAAAGSAVAIRTKDTSTGKGYDGDCTVTVSMPYPLGGEQVVTCTASPTLDGGRTPSAYV